MPGDTSTSSRYHAQMVRSLALALTLPLGLALLAAPQAGAAPLGDSGSFVTPFPENDRYRVEVWVDGVRYGEDERRAVEDDVTRKWELWLGENPEAADLAVRMYHEPDAREQSALDEITARGAERTWITETVSMTNSAPKAAHQRL